MPPCGAVQGARPQAGLYRMVMDAAQCGRDNPPPRDGRTPAARVSASISPPWARMTHRRPQTPRPRWPPGLRRAALAPLLLLAACAAVPPPPSRDVPLPAHWHGAAEAPGAVQPDLAAWWRAFGDPRLDALVDAAQAQNLGVAEARHRLEAARSQASSTRLRYVPNLSARTVSAANVESTASYFQVGFDASWELGLFGRRRGDLALAGADVGAAAAEVDAARVSVVAEVARTYLELRAAQARLALQQRQRALAEADLARARRLQALGLAAVGDVDKAQAALRAEQARAPALAAAPILQAQALAQLLGRSEPDPSWLEPSPLCALPPPAAAPLPAQLLRTRPEIRRAEWAVARAAGELGIARSELWPQLSLGGSLTYASKIDGDELLKPTSILSLGPMITAPLLDWGQRRASVLAHGELLAAAVTRYRAAVVEGAAEVQNGLAALAAARARYEALEAQSREAPQRLERTRRLQVLGLADAADLAVAERSEVDLEFERVDAQVSAGLALVAVYKALGGAAPTGEGAPP